MRKEGRGKVGKGYMGGVWLLPEAYLISYGGEGGMGRGRRLPRMKGEVGVDAEGRESCWGMLLRRDVRRVPPSPVSSILPFCFGTKPVFWLLSVRF